jgi:acyl-CoA dehydrogenase
VSKLDFEYSDEQRLIADLARRIAEKYPPEYWREKDERHEFAEEYWRDVSEAGFVGTLIPEEYGGAGMGMEEMIVAIENLCRYGTGMAGVWYLMLTGIFAALPIARYGTREQKEKYLPRISRGEIEGCAAITEPNAGTNTLRIETYAEKKNGEYIINGNKVFISGVDRAELMVLVTRTIPYDETPRKTMGLTLFLVELPNKSVKWSPIPKHGINYSHTCEVSIDNLRLSEDDILGPIDGGWYVLLDILNPERMGFSAGAVGLAKLAISKAVEYSKERKVFADPIGSYQSLQHPLAEAYSSLECAKLMVHKAAWIYDKVHRPPSNPRDLNEVVGMARQYKEVGDATNMAKVVAVENAIKAVYWAMQIYGGYGYAKEFDVERWWREINLLRLAPVTQQMALNYIAQHILGMPRSYR